MPECHSGPAEPGPTRRPEKGFCHLFAHVLDTNFKILHRDLADPQRECRVTGQWARGWHTFNDCSVVVKTDSYDGRSSTGHLKALPRLKSRRFLAFWQNLAQTGSHWL